MHVRDRVLVLEEHFHEVVPLLALLDGRFGADPVRVRVELLLQVLFGGGGGGGGGKKKKK